MSELREFVDALRELLQREDLQRRFMTIETTKEAQKELHLSNDDTVNELKSVLTAINGRPSAGGSISTTYRPADDGSIPGQRKRKARDSIDQAEKFLDNSFGQLRTAYRVSLAMSVSIFVTGVAFLLIAAIRSFTHPGGVSDTAVIGGIGIIQIVALFYRNPVRDVARSVSKAQQSRMAIMSYMLGVSLLGESVYHDKQTEKALDLLHRLTRDALSEVEQSAGGQIGHGVASSTLRTERGPARSEQ
jgi:hypothetical protein